MFIKITSIRIFLGTLFLLPSNLVIAWELSGYVGLESLGFFQSPVDPQQQHDSLFFWRYSATVGDMNGTMDNKVSHSYPSTAIVSTTIDEPILIFVN